MMEKCTETEPVTVQFQSMMVILALEKNLILRIAQVPIQYFLIDEMFNSPIMRFATYLLNAYVSLQGRKVVKYSIANYVVGFLARNLCKYWVWLPLFWDAKIHLAIDYLTMQLCICGINFFTLFLFWGYFRVILLYVLLPSL